MGKIPGRAIEWIFVEPLQIKRRPVQFLVAKPFNVEFLVGYTVTEASFVSLWSQVNQVPATRKPQCHRPWKAFPESTVSNPVSFPPQSPGNICKRYLRFRRNPLV